MLTRDARGDAVLSGTPVRDLLAQAGIGTPAYLYDLDAIVAEAVALSAGFAGAPHLVAYAVKACSAGPVIRALAEAGCGADVVSGGELALTLASGVPADRVLFSGVAKTDAELDQAIAAGGRGILAVQIESIEEIARVEARAAALGRSARASIRVNPAILADTHAHVATGHDEAKFGVPRDDLAAAFEAFARAPHVELVGLSCHVGSQLTQTGDYVAAARVIAAAARARQAATGRALAFIDFGGGFAIDYGARTAAGASSAGAVPVRGRSGEAAPAPARPADFAAAAVRVLAEEGLGGTRLVVEPGRSLVGAHGVLCASVIMAKRSRTDAGRRWLMIDAGMNDLIRPALYGAYHRVEPIDGHSPSAGVPWRVVGPVCESSDDFGEHLLPDPPPARVILRDAGAYGYVMASQYNGRALPVEAFVRSGRVVAVSRPRTVDDWVRERASIGAERSAPETPTR